MQGQADGSEEWLLGPQTGRRKLRQEIKFTFPDSLTDSAIDYLLEICRGRKVNVNKRELSEKWKDKKVLHVRLHYGVNALIVYLVRTIIYSLEYQCEQMMKERRTKGPFTKELLKMSNKSRFLKLILFYTLQHVLLHTVHVTFIDTQSPSFHYL